MQPFLRLILLLILSSFAVACNQKHESEKDGLFSSEIKAMNQAKQLNDVVQDQDRKTREQIEQLSK